jgi:hypothetical protein
MFEGMNCGLAGYRGEIVEELVQCLPAFEVVQKRLKRNTRPAKNRRAPEHLRISGDHAIQ